MKPSKPQYDFSQPSPTGVKGFETFRSQKDDKYYFHFNDPTGIPVLYSLGYVGKKSRDNALKKTIELASDMDQVERNAEGDSHYFVFRGGTQKEIARSRTFMKADDMEKRILELMAFIQENELEKILENAEPKQKESNPKTATTKVNTPSKKTKAESKEKKPLKNEQIAHTKSRFTIDLYRTGPDYELRGKIEHPLTGDKKSFRGLDHETVFDFLEKHGPQPVQAPKKIKSVKESIEVEEIKEFKLSGTGTHGGWIVSKNVPLEVSLKLPELKEQEFANYYLKVEAKSLERQQTISVGHQEDSIPNDRKLVIQTLSNRLVPGMYRLQTSVKLYTIGSHKERIVKGSQILQVY